MIIVEHVNLKKCEREKIWKEARKKKRESKF